jgi:hypothetical protein
MIHPGSRDPSFVTLPFIVSSFVVKNFPKPCRAWGAPTGMSEGPPPPQPEERRDSAIDIRRGSASSKVAPAVANGEVAMSIKTDP